MQSLHWTPGLDRTSRCATMSQGLYREQATRMDNAETSQVSTLYKYKPRHRDAFVYQKKEAFIFPTTLASDTFRILARQVIEPVSGEENDAGNTESTICATPIESTRLALWLRVERTSSNPGGGNRPRRGGSDIIKLRVLQQF
jgi:hypothetical protein